MKIKHILTEDIISDKVASSNLDEVEYNTETEELDITFLSGRTYRYFNVPQDVHQELLNAPSHGKYFYAYIRNGGYDYERIS